MSAPGSSAGICSRFARTFQILSTASSVSSSSRNCCLGEATAVADTLVPGTSECRWTKQGQSRPLGAAQAKRKASCSMRLA